MSILFPYKRTKRIAVMLRELTLGEAIAVCRLPAARHEATTTEFLRFAASKAETPTPAHLTDPRKWTTEERALLVCHYLSQVSEAADFSVGDGGGVLSDYVDFADDFKGDRVSLGKIGDREWVLRPLLGAHLEVLELLCREPGDWVIGALACQARPADEELDVAALPDIKLMEWCSEAMKAVKEMPESAFGELYAAAEVQRAELRHFFDLGVGEEGVFFWPRTQREGGPSYPARFRALPCISAETERLFRVAPGSGR